MSFSFGSATTTSANTFGTATPSTGLAFGSGDAAKPFGASNTENKPAFNFNAASSNTPAFGGFMFGAKTTTAASSLFNTPATTAASAFGTNKPLSFGGFTSPPNQTVGSPSFGQQAQQSTPQNVPFGGTQQQPAPAFGTSTTQAASPAFGSPSGIGGSFSMGKPAATSAPTGFGFGTPASGFSAPQAPTASTASQPSSFLSPQGSGLAAKPAFSFGGSAGQTPSFGSASASTAAPAFGSTSTPTFSLGQQATTASIPFASTPATQAQTGPSFGTTPTPSFGAQQPTKAFGSFQTPSSGLSFGNTATTTQSGLSFTSPQTSAPQTGLSTAQPTNLSTGLSFGSATTSQPATNSGLSFTTTTASTGISFGKAPSSQATTGLSFGTTTSGLSFGTPASTAATTAGLGFGTASTAQTTAGLSFGSTTTTSSAAASTPSSIGLSFGTTTSAAQPAGLSFGVTSKPATQTSTAIEFASSGPPGLFGAKTTAATSGTASTTATSGIATLGKSTATTMPSLSTAITTTPSVPPAAVSSITFAQLEENINKWTLELEEQEKTFINQATQINAWDRLLIANGEKIVELNDAVQSVKNEQQSLEHELDFVLAQQKELEDLLAPLEKNLLEDAGDRLRDPEREQMYSLAENLDSQLRQMSEDLKEVIEHLNETNRSQDSNDPIVQIGRILNAHMSSMQWIDNSITQISTKLDQLKATHDTLRRDNERSFQLTYN